MPKGTRTIWWVYLVRCRDGSLYTGVTTDVARRVRQHNAGTASKYTRSRRPVNLAYSERAKGQGQALGREAAIKVLRRKEKEDLVSPGLRKRSKAESGVLSNSPKAGPV